MLRDPRVRGARRRAVPRRRGPRLRAPVDRAGGVGRRRVLAARPGRRDHVHPPRPRPLPREGSRPARDVRRADGQGRGHEPRARAARCTSPIRRSASSAPTGSWVPACRSRWAPRPRRSCDATAASRWRSSATARWRTARFHEAVNLAAVWQLPVVFFCENNGYAEFSPASTQHAAPLERRAAGYGVDYVARRRQRRRGDRDRDARRWSRRRAPGAVPVVVEAATYRWHGHYEGDPERYRSADEVREWEARDPLLVNARQLRSAGITDDGARSDARRRSRDELDDAVEAARQLARTVGRDADRLRHPPATRARRRAAARRPPTRRCSARWTRSGPRSKPSSPATSACSSPGSTSPPAATCSA